jgi:hypothetical protein
MSIGGFETRVLHGSRPVGDALSLGFNNLLEADARLIKDHYRTQNGGFYAFYLSNEVLAGGAYNPTPSGQLWRYASPPSVEWVRPGVATVTVELVAVS